MLFKTFFLTWVINIGVDPASVCFPHQWPVVAESVPTPAPWTAPARPPRPSSPRVGWALVNVSCTKPFCWADVGTCGSRKGGSEMGFPHSPSTRSTEIWGIILRSCKPGWGELRGGSPQHSRRREGNREGVLAPASHTCRLVPCCNFMGVRRQV